MSGDSFEFRLIGTVEVLNDGVPVALPGRRVRALTALLALSAGRTVAVETLARGIWDDDPPARVRGSLQTYVGRLRALIGSDVVVTEQAGYRLDVPRTNVDLLSFADAAEAAARSTDAAAERAALSSALERWVDEPFGDPPSEWIARHEVPSWTERYLQAVERRSDLDIEAGDHAGCVVELNRHVERYPLRETLWSRLLIALDRSGRTAEALERYESVRKRLAEELGVDPAPDLRAVHADLLSRADEPVGAAPHPGTARDRGTARVPAQLPVATAGFVGRADVIQALDRLALDSDEPGTLVALHGLAGSGKTTVAIRWGRDNLREFPDGQLFVNLRGYGPGDPATPGQALDGVLRAIGVNLADVPAGVEERSALFRSELADRRMLVVLDNARDSDQVRPLLPGGSSAVLVTSRSQLRSLVSREGAKRLAVGQMPAAEAVMMLQRRIGPEADRTDLVELAGHCGYLPVALAVAAERVDRDGVTGTESLNAQLRDRRRRLDALSTGDDDPLSGVRTVIESSYRALDEDAATAFRCVGMYEDPHVSAAAVAAIAGIELADAERRLDRLVNQNLLMSLGSGWYQCHDLLRDVAIELGVSKVDAQTNADAVARLWSWCLHSTRNASTTVSRPRNRSDPPPVLPGVTPVSFDSSAAASQWLADHVRFLRSVVDEAFAQGDPTGYRLAGELFIFLNATGRLREELDLYERAEAQAAAAGDLLGQAECANFVGGVHADSGRHDRALEAAYRSRDLYERAGELTGSLKVASNIALTLLRLERPDEAVAAYEEMLETAQRHELDLIHGIGLGDVAMAYLAVGRVDDATRAAGAAVTELRELDHPHALSQVLECLGDAQVASGALVDATTSYEQAAELGVHLAAGTFAASSMVKLGRVYRDLGRHGQALAAWRRTLRLLDHVGVAETFEVSREEVVDLIDEIAPVERRVAS